MNERILYMSTRSPYARKILLALKVKGLAFKAVGVDFANLPPEFVAVTPLRKIPVLVDEDGTHIFDSTCIAQWLEERYPQPPLYPADLHERNTCRQMEELADAVADQAVALFQQTQRPDGGDRLSVEKMKATLERLMIYLEQMAPPLGFFAGEEHWDLRDMALVSSLGYLTFRHGDSWRERYPRLAAYETRANEFPMFRETLPRV